MTEQPEHANEAHVSEMSESAQASAAASETAETSAEESVDNDAHETDTASRTDDPFVGITADLLDLGRGWARHGIGVGQQALVNTARTLELTAETLGRVADRLRSDARAR